MDGSPLSTSSVVGSDAAVISSPDSQSQKPQHEDTSDCQQDQQQCCHRSHTSMPINPLWTQISSRIRYGITQSVVIFARHAALHPKAYIVCITLLSLAIVPIGFFTNFRMEVEQEAILAPFGSLARADNEWINNDSGFPQNTRPFDVLFHADGANVLGKYEMEQVFAALAVARETPGYDAVCETGSYTDFDNVHTCQISSATRFWFNNETYFKEHVPNDRAVIDTLSTDKYPLGTPVDHDFILGNYEVDTNGTLSFVQSYLVRVMLPNTEGFLDLENLLTERLKNLREVWQHDPNQSMRLEIFHFRSIPNEFERAIRVDLPLYPAVFFIMCAFTCLVFFRRHWVHSRSLLGVGAVVTIALSLCTGNGLMWLCGVPLTNLTMSLAFVIFGVGLDDTFIITGEYSRTDSKKDPVKRIEETMKIVGLSIFLTSLTTTIAFFLGSFSAIPAIRWLCYYAVPTVIIGFFYQITFFVALLVMDERRVQVNRRDCCFCFRADNSHHEDTSLVSDSDVESVSRRQEVLYPPCLQEQQQQHTSAPAVSKKGDLIKPSKDYVERFMACYAGVLLRPWVKIMVVVMFTVFLVNATFSATLLKQEFKAEEIVPADSYVKGFLQAINHYSTQIIVVGVYFRDIDQSDPAIQQQMMSYIDDLATLKQFGEKPPFCWVRDFKKMEEDYSDLDLNFTFAKKLDMALSIPAVKEVYAPDIVRDEEGNIIASRCWLFAKHVDMSDVQDQTNMLLAQRAMTASQSINAGRSRWAVFNFDVWYIIFEFYAKSIRELIGTTISGVVAVCGVCFLFLPHWTGVLFVTPLTIAVYVDLLGTLRFAGININVVTYVCMVIAVGLLVDFLCHVLLRYYESKALTREDKVKDTLESMGPSILLGGLSTFLGVVPLAFSSNEVAKVVFTSFFCMVVLGLAHGLIFLPVVLSIMGPVNQHHDFVTNNVSTPNKSDLELDVDPEEQGGFAVFPFRTLRIMSEKQTRKILAYQSSRKNTEDTKLESFSDGTAESVNEEPTTSSESSAEGLEGEELAAYEDPAVYEDPAEFVEVGIADGSPEVVAPGQGTRLEI